MTQRILFFDYKKSCFITVMIFLKEMVIRLGLKMKREMSTSRVPYLEV